MLVAAAENINANADKLTDAEKEAFEQVKKIIVTGDPNQKAGATGKHEATFQFGDMRSAAWNGSLIAHEGQHMLNRGMYSGSNLWRDEKSARMLQLSVGTKLGFTQWERTYLGGISCDGNWMAMQRHMEKGYP